jgi:hypothetical protein
MIKTTSYVVARTSSVKRRTGVIQINSIGLACERHIALFPGQPGTEDGGEDHMRAAMLHFAFHA